MNSKNLMEKDWFASKLPGIERLDEKTIEGYREKLSQRGESYKPRTHHLNPDGSAKYTNRLFLETSPYLLQHAHNPVDWYPWGSEAFDIAKKLDRPVLVSVGYSTCHWCHVMEEESFEDLEIAQFLNQNYICIKVDREERPDVDAVYIAVAQAVTGSGGWPLNVMLSPDQKPFWGGTYFPARDGDRGSPIGFLSIIKRISAVFKQNKTEIENSTHQIGNAISNYFSSKKGTDMPKQKLLDEAIEWYRSSYDPVNGGIKGALKFPSSLPLSFLMRVYLRSKSKSLLEMVEMSLDKMANGGIYDQVAGGFHRYATDAVWLVPHFEKMLYDNALLSSIYIEAYKLTKRERYKEIAIDVLEYVQREMTSSEGAFFSATDADSLNQKGERDEGYYFTWTPDELTQVLETDQLELVNTVYSVTETGNFEGRNILFLQEDLESYAVELGMDIEELKDELKKIKTILYEKRNQRDLPGRDEKIITSWNSLMISAFAKVGAATENDAFIQTAIKAAEFIKEHLYIEGRLYRIHKDGESKNKGFLSDYANYTAACLDLFQATHEETWLQLALSLEADLTQHFEDKENGGFYMTGSDQEALFTSLKPTHDSALPSGNGIALQNLVRLYYFTLDEKYRARFEDAVSGFLGAASHSAAGQVELLIALDMYLQGSVEVVVVTASDKASEAEPFIRHYNNHYLPNSSLAVVEDGEKLKSLEKIIPYVANKTLHNNKVTAYVCENGSCNLPTTDLTEFDEQISALAN